MLCCCGCCAKLNARRKWAIVLYFLSIGISCVEKIVGVLCVVIAFMRASVHFALVRSLFIEKTRWIAMATDLAVDEPAMESWRAHYIVRTNKTKTRLHCVFSSLSLSVWLKNVECNRNDLAGERLKRETRPMVTYYWFFDFTLFNFLRSLVLVLPSLPLSLAHFAF